MVHLKKSPCCTLHGGKKVVKKNNLNVVDLINDIYLENFDIENLRKGLKKENK